MQERPLLLATIALAAGEPKRALRILDTAEDTGDVGAAAAALAYAAHAQDTDWCPGGGGVPRPDENDRYYLWAVRRPTAVPGTAALALVSFLAVDVFPTIHRGRALADSVGAAERSRARAAELSHRYPTVGLAGLLPTLDVDALRGQALEVICNEDDRLVQRLRELDSEAAIAYLVLSRVDCARRLSGGEIDTGDDWARLLQWWSWDPVAEGHVRFVRGDALLEPASHPELRGLHVGGDQPPEAGDIAEAEAEYVRADALYAGAASPRGRAAVMLRLAHCARRRGDHARCAQQVADARRLAERAGRRRWYACSTCTTCSTGWVGVTTHRSRR